MMYRRDGLVYTTIKDKSWGNVKVARILPKDGDNWGEFKELADTEWAKMINEVSNDVYDMAFRNHVTPLMKVIGRDPKGNLKLMPMENGCRMMGQCQSEKPICSKVETAPFCVMPKTELQAVQTLLSAWREGYYVIRIRS